MKDYKDIQHALRKIATIFRDPYEKSNTCKKDNCSGCLSTEMIDEYWSDHVPVPRKLKGRDTLKDANTWNQENDVIWSNTDQSHTKWNIRDEKIDVHKAENQNKKKAAKNSNSWYDTWTDTWNDNKVASDSMRSRSKRQNEGKDKGQVPHYNDSCERRNVDRKDTWNKYFRNETTDHCRSDYLSDQRKLRRSYRFKQNDNQHGSNHPKISQKRTRGVGYYNCDSDRKPQTSYSGDKFRRTDYNRSNSRKKYSYRSHSRSTNGSNHVENQFTITAYNLWQNEKISEYQTKQDRVEKWVKSVNKINMWESKEFSSNPKIFAHDIEARFSSKLSLEQKEESTSSFTNLDQYEVNHNKSSEKEYDADLSRGNKSCENSNYASQWDYNETKNQNKDAAYNVGSAKHMGRMKKKGVQTKYSPQYSSVSSTKKENFKKQRFVGKDQKDDERNRYKFKIHDNSMTTNETWKNSTLDSTRNKTTSGSKLGNTDTCNQDDGFWSYTSQSHIKWKISDEEIDVQETKNQNKKKTEMSSDMRNNWNDNQVASNSKKRMSKRQNEEKCKCQVPPDNESDTSKDAYTWNQEDDGLWGNTDQSHIKWNISDEEIDAHEVENQSKKKAANSDSWYDTWTDNWNDNQVVSGSMRSRSKRQNEGKDKHQVPRDNGRNEGNISEYYSNSAARQQNSYAQESYWNEDAIVNSFKCSVYISEGKE